MMKPFSEVHSSHLCQCFEKWFLLVDNGDAPSILPFWHQTSTSIASMGGHSYRNPWFSFNLSILEKWYADKTKIPNPNQEQNSTKTSRPWSSPEPMIPAPVRRIHGSMIPSPVRRIHGSMIPAPVCRIHGSMIPAPVRRIHGSFRSLQPVTFK